MTSKPKTEGFDRYFVMFDSKNRGRVAMCHWVPAGKLPTEASIGRAAKKSGYTLSATPKLYLNLVKQHDDVPGSRQCHPNWIRK